MPSASELEKICAAIVQRRTGNDTVECTACRAGCSGIDDLWEHLESSHGIIELPPCDNLAKLDEFLGLIPALANRLLMASSDDVVACFLLAAENDDGADLAEENRAIQAASSTLADAGEDEFDDGISVTCLFCDVATTTIEEHMKSAHQFDLRASTLFEKAVCADEYDRMRMVNFVRRRVQDSKCPAGCDTVLSTSADVAVHVSQAAHFLPAVCPQGDDFLMPAMKGDGMLMLVMASEDDFADEEESAKYPMVPTVGETLRMRMANQPTAAASAAAPDDS
jgi:hypothetical protein